MKKALITVLLLTLLFTVGCQVPDDVAQAEVGKEVTEEQKAEMETPNGATETTESVPINLEASSFAFEGYAPGKSHMGTFDEMEGSIIKSEGIIVGIKGIIQAASVNTGISGLDDHLKNDDFFDVEGYPTIEFTSTKIEDGQLSGTLNFHGVTKEVSFPVQLSENSITADFLLDTTDFKFKYVGVDKDVKITFTLSE